MKGLMDFLRDYRRSEERLPLRVRRAIEAQQQQSEVLIAWVLLAVVALFSLLYAISPKTFPAEVKFVPVPWALGSYFVFSLIRLALALRGYLPGWFLTLSVVADIVLLMVLIWSFHLQYMQPAALYLKAPTLLYVFIFIALRALRFDSRYVLLAGGMAAFGWAVLVAYAVFVDDGMARITRDYVAYIFGDKILLGAEFDKIITILLTTAILAVAIMRARRLLVSAVSDQARVDDLSRFFSPEIARQITASGGELRPGQGRLRQAAILSCDIEGSTTLAKKVPPDELMSLLVEYERRLVPVIQKYGGSIDKFMGDGILATFGAAVSSPTYCADALCCLEVLLSAAAAWRAEREAMGQEPLTIRFTIASGEVVFGMIGDESRLEFTVLGEAVNIAIKLDKFAKEIGCLALVDRPAFELARRQGYEPSRRTTLRPRQQIGGVEGVRDVVAID